VTTEKNSFSRRELLDKDQLISLDLKKKRIEGKISRLFDIVEWFGGMEE
jgi:hypothetical protein